ncbi:hypothetical protein [Maricaulis sp. CAU 1757]
MTKLANEAARGLIGSWRLLTFRSGWENCFNISVGGFWRSFAAAGLAVPLLALAQAGATRAGYPVPMSFLATQYVLSWLAFPIAAAVAARMAGAKHRIVPWIIIHNWSVLWLYGLQACMAALFVAGLLSIELLALFSWLYIYVRILVHWRIAYGALGLPTITSALVAAVPILVGHIVSTAVFLAMTSAQSPGAIPT